MSRSLYGYATAKVKARSSRFSFMQDLSRLEEAKSVGEALYLLSETDLSSLSSFYEKSGDLLEVEAALWSFEAGQVKIVEKDAPRESRPFIAALLSVYEITLLKKALRSCYSRSVFGRDLARQSYLFRVMSGGEGYFPKESFIYNIPFSEISALSTGIESAFDLLSSSPYEQICSQSLSDVRRSHSLFPLETALDRYALSLLRKQASYLPSSSAGVLHMLVSWKIDHFNLSLVLGALSGVKLRPPAAQTDGTEDSALGHLFSGGRLALSELSHVQGGGSSAALISSFLSAYHAKSTGEHEPTFSQASDLTLSRVEEHLSLSTPLGPGPMTAFILKLHRSFDELRGTLNKKFYYEKKMASLPSREA